MKNKYLTAGLLVLAVSVFAVSVASAQANSRYVDMMGSGNGAHMSMMGMMQAHSAESIDEMKEEMREHHQDLADEGINKMIERCPMMRAGK